MRKLEDQISESSSLSRETAYLQPLKVNCPDEDQVIQSNLNGLPNSSLSIEVKQIFAEAKQKGWAEGLQQGFDEGYNQGVQQAKAEITAAYEKELADKSAQLSLAIDLLVQPSLRIDEAVAQQIVALSKQLAQYLYLRELQHAPEQLLVIVQDALQYLPCHQTPDHIFLNPNDFNQLQQLGHSALTAIIEADSHVAPGAFRIKAGHFEIDGDLNFRLAQLLESPRSP